MRGACVMRVCVIGVHDGARSDAHRCIIDTRARARAPPPPPPPRARVGEDRGDDEREAGGWDEGGATVAGARYRRAR